MGSFFLGFDLGSHSTKGVITGENGIPLASKSLTHSTQIPNTGWQEQNPAGWWKEFTEITKYLLEKSSVSPSTIRGIGITGFVPGLIALDRDGKVLRPAIMHTDIRAGSQLRAINTALGVEISHGFLMPKLLWVKEHEAGIYNSIYKVLVPHSYIVKKLTGKYSCDRDTATIFGGVYDHKSRQWSNEICRKLDVPVSILPEIYDADSIAGKIEAEAAELTGLAEGTPVIAGTGDTFAAILGCGAVLPGDMMIYLGTSGTQLFIDGNLEDFTAGPHFGSGKAEFTGRIVSCGDSMQHYRDILGFTDWTELDRAALGIDPGSGGLFIFPHMKQKSADETSPGDLETIFGLETSHSPWHIYRAVMEGIAANLKTSFSDYRSRVGRLILSGGGARSRVFRDIVGAMLNMELYYNPLGDGAIGVALLAAHTVTGASLLEASSEISGSAGKEMPCRETAKTYQSYYSRYVRLRNKIENLYIEGEQENNE